VMVAFTALLMFLALMPTRMRQRLGIEGRTREPMRRYNRRMIPAMLGYVVLLLGAITYAQQAEPTGVLAWVVAIAPAIPILFAIRAIFLLPREEDDEYQRDLTYRVYAWATGATLTIATVVGFLDLFGVIPHVEMWVAFPLWAVAMGLARCLPMGGGR
jgi:cytochrome bd-type quinol oxidase subunit 2